jgi:small-conductance mechanosensitive channel
MLQNFLSHLDSVGYLLLTVNILLLVFAKRIIQLFSHEPATVTFFSRSVMTFQLLNLLIIVVYGYYRFFQTSDEQAFGIKIIAVLAIIYLSYLSMHLMQALILRQYGKKRLVEGKERQTPTHQTRLLTVFSSVFIAIIALIGIIHFLGFTSLLEAGGVVGFMGVFLALTSSIWAPDIFHGIIILNSDMLSEGDVIELEDANATPIIAVVYRTKMFHTVMLNQVNNHRVMIRNSRLRDMTIHNLSKFASARGLREKLSFKIGYDCSISAVENMFSDAYEHAKIDADIPFETQYEMELMLEDTGDHAVQWSFYYYTKDIDVIISTRQKMMRVVYEASLQHNISLATPTTYMRVGEEINEDKNNSLEREEKQ